jgi:hypothetical protein
MFVGKVRVLGGDNACGMGLSLQLLDFGVDSGLKCGFGLAGLGLGSLLEP